MSVSEIAQAELERLKQLDTCTVANAVESFGVRLRNIGFTASSLHSIFPDFPSVVGYAATARVRTSAPPMERHNYYDRTDWWTHIVSAPAPRIVVLEDMDAPPGIGALVGEIHANILHALGCVAVVTNGAVRDLPMVRNLKFQMFAGNVSVSHAYAHVFEFGSGVTVGGMKVLPGDLLHGDAHGVLNVPLEIADKIANAAEGIIRREKQIIALCQDRNFTTDKLREAVKAWKMTAPEPNDGVIS
jgi:4-hydroxy-4-methyl-2-oxoglutarate aldolase